MSRGPGLRRRVLGAVLGTVSLLAVTLLPSLAVTAAPTKKHWLEVTPSSAIAGTSTVFSVKVTNKTAGNSNANSFWVRAPNGFTVTAASIDPSRSFNPNASATVEVVSPRVNVRFLDPLKLDQFVTVNITATTPSITGCSQGGFTWTDAVFSGSNLSGDMFALNNAGAAQQTTLLSCLALQFVQGFEPTDGAIGTDMHVKVEAVVGNTVFTSFTGEITIELEDGPAGAALSGNVATAVGGVADFPNFQGDTAGDYVVKATSGAAESDPTPPFTLFDIFIDCTNPTASVPLGEGNTATISFLDECKFVPLTITFDPDQNRIDVEKPPLDDTVLTVVVDNWPSEVANIPPHATIVSTPGGVDEDVLPCDGTSDEPIPLDPTLHTWCLFRQSLELVGPAGGIQQMQLQEELLLFGDAHAKR